MSLITLSYHTSLVAAASATATAIRVADQADLCDTVTNHGKHVVLTLFNAKYSEQVLATGCEIIEGIQHVTVQRGFAGTTARDWASDTCLCASRIVDACDTGTGGSGGSGSGTAECTKPLAGVEALGCLEIVDGDTCFPKIRMKSFGVTPVQNDCIHINECGLVTWISPNFPNDCLPVFDPCSPCAACGGTGTPGATSADLITYSGPGNVFVLGPNVSSALNQIDIQLQNLTAGTYISTITAGDGISIGGPASDPVISLLPVMATPGEYDGFTVNEFGQITEYNQPDATQHVGVPPINVTYDLTTDTWTYEIDVASTTAPGIVQLVDESQILSNSVASTSDGFVVTWAGLLAFLQSYMPKLDTSEGVQGSTGIFNTDRNLKLAFNSLAAAVTLASNDVFAFFETATGTHKKIGKEDFAVEIGAAYAAAIVTSATGTLVANRNVGAVVRNAAGNYTVTMLSTGTLPASYVVSAIAVNHNTPYYVTYNPASANSFDIRFYDMAGVLMEPAQFSFTVTAAS